jgi:hypothetical protein
MPHAHIHALLWHAEKRRCLGILFDTRIVGEAIRFRFPLMLENVMSFAHSLNTGYLVPECKVGMNVQAHTLCSSMKQTK